MSSFSFTSLTTHSAVENLEPVKSVYLFKQIASFRAREYWWGLEPGKITIDSQLNCVSVRGDIGRLLSDRALTLVPTEDVVDIMLKLTSHNREHPIHERQNCFEVLPAQEYHYRLVPGSQMKKKIPLFAFESSGAPQQFDYPYDNLPLFNLACYPFHSIMHNDYALSRSPPVQAPFRAIFKLCSRWQDVYPHVGSFAMSPRIAAIVAAHAAADKDYDPYSDLEGTSGEDNDMISGSETESESESEVPSSKDELINGTKAASAPPPSEQHKAYSLVT